MEKVKILRITTEVNRSSIGRTAEQIGRLIIAEGWESYIAWGRTDGKSESYKIKIGNKASIFFHVLLTRLFDLHGYGSFFATKKFVKKIKEINPSIIHLHDIHGYYINLKVLFDYLKQSNIPVVWTHHDNWAFTGHCGSMLSTCEKWKKECYDCPIHKRYPGSLFYDGSTRNYRLKKRLFTSLVNLYNVGVSEWTCNQLRQSFLKSYPIERIYNGVDTSIFIPDLFSNASVRAKYNLGNGILLTAVATAWSKNKGIDDYFELRKILDKKYTILFVGAPQELIDTLPDGIIGIRRTDSMEELAKIYSASSIIMNLSASESFGKTTPEGMACGVPSIVYNCTASPELVDEKTGRVVERGDIKEIVKAIEDIMSWDREKTSEACRNRACSLFSIQNNWPKYIALYKEILKKKQTEGNPLF